MNDYVFGNFLCMLREQKGLTQADLSGMLGVTPAAVSKWENGSSKPRVEVLFQLAQILGVRPEELMAGHYIEENTLDPEAVKQINKRYEYLRKVDSFNTGGTKFRRVLAWLIDWNLVGLAVIIILTVYLSFWQSVQDPNVQIGAFGMMIICLMYPIGFVLRDVIGKGRSVGKRIMKLVVLDKQTGEPAKAGKCLLRNVFLPVLQVDAIMLFVTGATIGDRAAHTAVVSKHVLENKEATAPAVDISDINHYSPQKTIKPGKMIAIILGVFVLFFGFIFAIVAIGLSTSKKTEEYKIAYEYLVESDSFKELGVDESKIILNRYSSSTYSYENSDAIVQTAEIGFIVRSKSFEVVCHEKNDVWIVCEECTKFD